MQDAREVHIVPMLDSPMRLQDYGVGIFSAAFTKSALKKVIKKEYVRVNNQTASTATYIHGGEEITLTIPQKEDPSRRLVFPLNVLFEDAHVAAIHKPAGIEVSGNKWKTIAHALPQNLHSSTEVDATRPQPVHRLDYATTGILLAGKTSTAIRLLNQLFEKKEVTKTYYAITIGKMAESGIISTPIDGKPAISHYRVVDRVISERFNFLNLVELHPQTGRRHQLRKHLYDIGHPILGDRDYYLPGLLLKGKGLYLHAHSLSFIHPITQEETNLSSPLPKRFQKIFPHIKL